MLNNRDDVDVRAGRAALLDLLAGLLLRELDAPVAEAISADPALSRALRPPNSAEELRLLRAEYASLFVIEIPPYASIYLDAPPVIGGDTSLRWEGLLTSLGRPLRSLERAASADHAGLCLRALADAERADDIVPVLREILRWLPQFLTSIERNARTGFYGRVAVLTAQVIQESARAAAYLGGATERDAPVGPEEMSLREIARWLTTPAWSGWFLSKHALRQLARPFGVATGRVDRAAALEQVFEASGLDSRTGELLTDLANELAEWEASLHVWQANLNSWAHTLAPWKASLRATRDVLDQMRHALEQGG